MITTRSDIARTGNLALFGFIVLLAIAWIDGCIQPAHAYPLPCEEVKDSDERHFCRACSGGSYSECELIKDSNRRAKCRAMCAPKPRV